jgi:hypothetical protein
VVHWCFQAWDVYIYCGLNSLYLCESYDGGNMKFENYPSFLLLELPGSFLRL